MDLSYLRNTENDTSDVLISVSRRTLGSRTPTLAPKPTQLFDETSGFVMLVRPRGLEPPRVAPLAPQASASTNSATAADEVSARRLDGAPRRRRPCNKSASPEQGPSRRDRLGQRPGTNSEGRTWSAAQRFGTKASAR